MSKTNPLKKMLRSLGPGFITGIADDDPSGIATYAQTGAFFGLSQLWLSLYSFPFMVAVQEMCARIGMATGNGLAGIIKKYYSKKLLYFMIMLLSIANIVNIGADLGAMGHAVSMISPFSSGVALIFITLFSIAAAIFIPYPLYVKVLKYFAATVFSYVLVAFFVKHNWQDITFNLFIPHFSWNKEFLLNVTAFLGTTISPYLFFWEADQEVEEEIEKKKVSGFGKEKPLLSKRDIRAMRKDTIIGMFLSNMISFFIVITGSAALSGTTSSMITATDLAEALRPLAGDYAVLLFAFGIIGTGLLAVPVLAGSLAYAVSETLGIKSGLGMTWREAPLFYATLSIATLLGVLLNFSNIDPMLLLYYAAAVNGLLAPPLLVMILFIANNKKILGDKVNGKWSNIFVVIITVVMTLIGIFTIESFIRP